MASKKKAIRITKKDMKTRKVDCLTCPIRKRTDGLGVCKGDFPLAKNCPLAKLVYAQQVEEENPIAFGIQ